MAPLPLCIRVSPPIAVLGAWGAEGSAFAAGNAAPASIEDLGLLADSLGIEQFWVHESALDPLGFPTSFRPSAPGAGIEHPFTSTRGLWQSSRAGLKRWGYWWRKGQGGFDLHIPAYEDGGRSGPSPFAGCVSPAELLCEASRFYGATRGARWCGTGSITSDNWLRGHLRGRLAPTEEPPPIEEGLAIELACVWHRQPAHDERHYRYCHGLDLNLSYAAPAGGPRASTSSSPGPGRI